MRYGVPRALLDNAFLAGRAIFRDGDLSPIVDGAKNVAAGLDATGHMIMRVDGAEPYDSYLMSDGSIQTPQMYDDGLSMALMTMTPEMAETGAGEAASLASNSPKMYNLPTLKPRPFEADYPLGAPSDATGRLTADTLGNPLGAQYVVGRAMVGEPDVALASGQRDFVPSQKPNRTSSTRPSAGFSFSTQGNQEMADKTLKTDGSEPARQNNAAALLPQLYQAAQLPASTMGAIGSAQDANTQAALTGQNDLFNRQNNADTDLLAELSGIFGGVAPIGGTNTVQTTPATPWWQVQRAWWGRSSRTDSRKGLKKQRFPRSREWLVNSGDAERIE